MIGARVGVAHHALAAACAWLVACGGGSPAEEPPPDADTGPPAPVDAGTEADASADDGGPPPRDGAIGSPCTTNAMCSDGDPCNGRETCVLGTCARGTVPPDGTFCDADGDSTNIDYCLAGHCTAGECGDGIVDTGRGEQCDDQNALLGDGCDLCAWTCDSDDACGPCERCDLATHLCAPGEDRGTCAEDSGTGEAGVCLRDRCSTDADCDDGMVCNGVETCQRNRCERGEPLDCDDGDACTEDACSAVGGGCQNALVDRDRDGWAPAALGECGQDCDDFSAAIRPLAPDVCDDVDNDCDAIVDEDDEARWYADCDGDGYATGTARSLVSCGEPAADVTGCPGGVGDWTLLPPSRPERMDCRDDDPRVNPGQTVPQVEPIPGALPDRDFDYDCDGEEEVLFDDGLGMCEVRSFNSCATTPGWLGEIPECGETGVMLERCHWVLLPGGEAGCVEIPGTTLRIQRCI